MNKCYKSIDEQIKYLETKKKSLFHKMKDIFLKKEIIHL